MKRNTIKSILSDMENAENKEAIYHITKTLDTMSDAELALTLERLNVTDENLEQFLINEINSYVAQTQSPQDFIKVNDYFSYGRTGNTVHMHIVPKDMHDLKNELGDDDFYKFYAVQLEDFLAKLQGVFKEDSTIETLFAVSPIFFNPNIGFAHESLGFDKITEVDPANENDDMDLEHKEYFLNMFNKNGSRKRKVYYTKMTREKILATEYSQFSEQKNSMEQANCK